MGIKITELNEITEVSSNSYLVVDNGTVTNKISKENLLKEIKLNGIDYINIGVLATIDSENSITDIIQNAFDNYDNIYIPAGDYHISRTLVFKNKLGFYGSSGYMGKKLLMDKATKLIADGDFNLLELRGSNNLIEGGILTYSESVTYTKSLFSILALDHGLQNDYSNISCNNIIRNLFCISLVNPINMVNNFNGIGIEMKNDGENAIYANQFIGCYIADMNIGIHIDNNSSVGINGNNFDLCIWNCHQLLKSNGSGNTFNGTCQSGRSLYLEQAAVEINGSYNIFNWYIWDVGQYPRTNNYAYDFKENAVNNKVQQLFDNIYIKQIRYNQVSFIKENNYLIRPDFNINDFLGERKNSLYYASSSTNVFGNKDIVTSVEKTSTNISTVYGALYTDLQILGNHNFYDKIVFSKSDTTIDGILTLKINLDETKCKHSYIDMVGIYGGYTESGLGNCQITIVGTRYDGSEELFEENQYKNVITTRRNREFFRQDKKTPENYYNNGISYLTITMTIPSEFSGNMALIALNYIYLSIGDMYKGLSFSSGNVSKLGDKISGDFTFEDGKGCIVSTPDGTKKYRIGVDNSGNITTTLI